MKGKLSYINVCILKWIAISMVIVAHYYRFYEKTSAISHLKSIGYFGAALFAFLSGYLGEINKDKVIKMGGEKVVNKKNMCCIYSVCDC